MLICSSYNQAGGVGKSTIAFNVGYHLAVAGKRTLLIDLDQQADLTNFCIGDDIDTSIHDSLLTGKSLPIVDTELGMSLVPATSQLKDTELALITHFSRELRLKKALDHVAGRFDVVLIDCPPGFGTLTANALFASTHLLIPVSTKHKGFRSTDRLLSDAKQIMDSGNPGLKIFGFVPNNYRAKVSHDEAVLAALQSQCSQIARVFDPLPHATNVDRSTFAHQPMALHSPRDKHVKIFQSIADALIEIL